jgi:mono/diheme cytochrome c family protein
MIRSVLVCAFLFIVLPLAIHAQQKPNTKSTLTEAEREGRRIFQQKCAVCHIRASSAAGQYGPGLFKGTVAGKEDATRKAIMDGTGDRMPGWKYALQPRQIDAVLSYLKTLDQPSRTVASERDEM